ncbi:unnamed protein product, partial [Didymodactylos carnosus]
GKLEFNRVSFVYPTRPNRIVLRQFSLQINPGPSGSGKSTTVQLLERFYDVVKGHVIIVCGINCDKISSKSALIDELERGVKKREKKLF